MDGTTEESTVAIPPSESSDNGIAVGNSAAGDQTVGSTHETNHGNVPTATGIDSITASEIEANSSAAESQNPATSEAPQDSYDENEVYNQGEMNDGSSGPPSSNESEDSQASDEEGDDSDSSQNSKQAVQTFSMLVMLAAILAPAIMYSFSLHRATPPELLIAVCLSVVCCTLAIWILNLTSTLNFKHEWMSRTVFFGAMISILGSAAGVYMSLGVQQTRPFEGQWDVTIVSTADGELLSKKPHVVTYSPSAESYWGFSDAREVIEAMRGTSSEEEKSKKRRVTWSEIHRLDPVDRIAEIRIYDEKGVGETLRTENLEISSDRTRIKGVCGPPGEFKIEFKRP